MEKYKAEINELKIITKIAEEAKARVAKKCHLNGKIKIYSLQLRKCSELENKFKDKEGAQYKLSLGVFQRLYNFR